MDATRFVKLAAKAFPTAELSRAKAERSLKLL
jgi:hypothetical protein